MNDQRLLTSSIFLTTRKSLLLHKTTAALLCPFHATSLGWESSLLRNKPFGQASVISLNIAGVAILFEWVASYYRAHQQRRNALVWFPVSILYRSKIKLGGEKCVRRTHAIPSYYWMIEMS
jgi:hypothetical protein